MRSEKYNLNLKLNPKGQVCEYSSALDADKDKIKAVFYAKVLSASQERRKSFMKSKKKLAIIAIAATLVLGSAVFASGFFAKRWQSTSSYEPSYTTLPSKDEVKKDVGYDVVLTDCFENGYAFKSGRVIDNNITDESGNSMEKYKSVSFTYEKDNDKLYFSQEKFSADTEMSGNVISTIKGTDIYYFSYTNKLVPSNYELTEADKKAKESGELVFSYGSSNVELKKVQSISFEKDGHFYQLMQIDGKLSKNELANMAKEIIECNF